MRRSYTLNMQYPGLTADESAALEKVAKEISTQPEWLWEVMNFESRLNPQAKNPLSTARGLIQFLDSTARGMGYTGSADLVAKHPTFTSQLLGPVRAYFLSSRPYPTFQSLFMKVFLPAARTVPPDTSFQKFYPTAASWAAFTKANPGIFTVADYIAKVRKAARGMWPTATVKKVVTTGAGGLFVLLVIAGFMLYKRGEASYTTAIQQEA